MAIYNLDKLQRVVIFEGLEHGKNTYPTDFDMIFNIRNEINIILDVKENFKAPIFGQTITYVNIATALMQAGTASYVVWSSHNDQIKRIYAKDTIVYLMWANGQWVTREKICEVFGCDLTYGELQDMLMKKHNVEEYDWKKHKFDKTKYMPPTV
jgi:hypothetical protein|tara:strand:+ start:314 stop:775 length:462 start_codon:yes stop_codon:yes gene_type:complete